MSIRRQDGARADVTGLQAEDLTPLEREYVERHPSRLKDLIFLQLRAYKNVSYTLMARAFELNKATPGRGAKRAAKRLQTIAREIFPPVARGLPDDLD